MDRPADTAGGDRVSGDAKKARPGEATPRRAETGAGLDRATTSTNDSTTGRKSGQVVHIADFLGRSQGAAVPLRHLEKLAHLPGREVRRLIQAERLRGVPILSNNLSGYFLPENDLERERFVRSMRGRAAEIEAVADAVEKAVIW